MEGVGRMLYQWSSKGKSRNDNMDILKAFDMIKIGFLSNFVKFKSKHNQNWKTNNLITP
jgi:hypothetical protein